VVVVFKKYVCRLYVEMLKKLIRYLMERLSVTFLTGRTLFEYKSTRSVLNSTVGNVLRALDGRSQKIGIY
jgi:hypothetical protein